MCVLPVCVFCVFFSIYVSIHALVFVYTLVGRGRGGGGNRRCLFLKVRSVLRHDALPFSPSPAADTRIREHRVAPMLNAISACSR